MTFSACTHTHVGKKKERQGPIRNDCKLANVFPLSRAFLALSLTNTPQFISSNCRGAAYCLRTHSFPSSEYPRETWCAHYAMRDGIHGVHIRTCTALIIIAHLYLPSLSRQPESPRRRAPPPPLVSVPREPSNPSTGLPETAHRSKYLLDFRFLGVGPPLISGSVSRGLAASRGVSPRLADDAVPLPFFFVLARISFSLSLSGTYKSCARSVSLLGGILSFTYFGIRRVGDVIGSSCRRDTEPREWKGGRGLRGSRARRRGTLGLAPCFRMYKYTRFLHTWADDAALDSGQRQTPPISKGSCRRPPCGTASPRRINSLPGKQNKNRALALARGVCCRCCCRYRVEATVSWLR